MAQLLEARESAYHSIPWQIDTMGKSVDEVADEVEALAGVYSLTVRHSQGSYPVHLGTGLRHRLGHALRAVGVHPGSQVVVISNPTIASLYAQDVEVALRIADLVPSLCIIPDGEEHKSLVTVQDLYDQFLATGMDRSGTVLALGGGVIGDVAGFAAATFMRGVRFIQVPTSLLAMVDASVGGKTGVDLPQGKNLVGAFKQPALVLIDPEVLKTLMPVEFRSGMAEVIKYAIIADVGLFDALACGPAMNVDEEGLPVDLLVRVLRVKIDVVEADPFEEEMRATLNLGHTVGHALEQLSGYKLRHGEGVACGLVAAARLAEALDQAENGLAEEISAVLDEWGLPTCLPHYPIDIILEAMVHDKKRKRGSLRWILPRRVGKVEIVADVPRAVVEGVLRSMRECDAPEGETEC
jgi:3-dehydroquinate synthase